MNSIETPQNEPQAPPAPLHPVRRVKGSEMSFPAVERLLIDFPGRCSGDPKDKEWVYDREFYFCGDHFLGVYRDIQQEVKA